MGFQRGNRERRLGRDDGQALVLVVLLLGVLLAMAAVVLDGSNLFVHRQAEQDTADSVALAAASDLPAGSGESCWQINGCTTLQNDADGYSGLNGGPQFHRCVDSGGQRDSDCFLTPYNGNDQQVQIRIGQTVHNELAGLLGVQSTPVSASAVAGLASPSSLSGVAPVGINESVACMDFTPTSHCAGPGNETQLNFDDAGTYALMDFCAQSSSGPTGAGNATPPTMEGWIEDGFNGSDCSPKVSSALPSPEWYGANTGVKNGVKQGFKTAADKDQVLLIPVFDKVSPSGSSNPASYHVIGWAAYEITQVVAWSGNGSGNGNQHIVDGFFTDFITGNAGGPSGSGCTFGVCVITLDQ
jgi:hypothetical protein